MSSKTTSLLNRPQFEFVDNIDNRVRLSDGVASVDIFILEEDIIRIRILPDGQLHGSSRTWAIAPNAIDVAFDGRDRLDCTNFTLPQFQIEHLSDPRRIVIATKLVQLTIELDGYICTWALYDKLNNRWHHRIAADRPTQAYNFGWWDARVYHYLVRRSDEIYLGLGERSGPINRAGRRYRMQNVDAMGYDAAISDPLYKHIPFYITWQPASACGFGLFYDTLSDCTFDMGCEISNYHGPYRYFVADYGDLDYYFIASMTTPFTAVKRFTWLTGRPALMPRWSLGYSGSTMSYTDASNAQQQMAGFIDQCRRHDILCESFHLSSGYTSIASKRYVFHWNRDKFPDIDAFVRQYRENGIRLVANIKPCLLMDHPDIDEVIDRQLLVSEKDAGSPSFSQFWGDIGAYLDFTNPDTIDWWKSKVTDCLLRFGITSTWNDNNEFEILSPKAMAHNFGRPCAACEIKPLQALAMMRASRDAQRDYAPDTRPFVVTRSGAVGMHRYAQTWSGDNYTSWCTLRYNIKMGLGLALSGVSNTGHDIGGFAGPPPDPELFVRWIQFGIFMPRFVIHSWNDDGSVTEPWMYDTTVTKHISNLIKFRHQFVPYLYHLLWKYATSYEPVLRPVFAEFPNDTDCEIDGDDIMIGSALLLAPIVAADQTTRRVYLPNGARWVFYWTGECFDGGQTIDLPCDNWNHPVVLIRECAVIPMNIAQVHFFELTNQLAFLMVPNSVDGSSSGSYFQDDGESTKWEDGEYDLWTLSSSSYSQTQIIIKISYTGDLSNCANVIIFIPSSEQREIVINGGMLTDKDEVNGWIRLCIVLNVDISNKE